MNGKDFFYFTVSVILWFFFVLFLIAMFSYFFAGR